MKTLEQVRDELAVEFAEDNYPTMPAHMREPIREIVGKSFKAGFDAAVALLAESAGEFDEKAAQRAWDNGANTAMTLARWQFEQDRARIGLAERMWQHGKIALQHQADCHRALMHEMFATAEARAANWKQAFENANMLKDTYREQFDRAKEVLEQRVRELERLRDEDAEIYEQALKERK